MREPLWDRIKQAICVVFGHRLKFSHHYLQDHYTCKRCRRFV